MGFGHRRGAQEQRYREGRGLTEPEMSARFQIGFANGTVGYRFPANNRNSDAVSLGPQQTLRFLRESGQEYVLLGGAAVGSMVPDARIAA